MTRLFESNDVNTHSFYVAFSRVWWLGLQAYEYISLDIFRHGRFVHRESNWIRGHGQANVITFDRPVHRDGYGPRIDILLGPAGPEKIIMLDNTWHLKLKETIPNECEYSWLTINSNY